MPSSFRFECGRLLCGQIREFLKDQIFMGKKIQYRESSGFVTRTFTIVGNADDITEIGGAIESFCEHGRPLRL